MPYVRQGQGRAFQYLTPPEWYGFGRRGNVRVRVHPRKRRRGVYDEEGYGEPVGVRVAVGLAALGAVRAYIRYDGGNDEGFAHFDYCQMQDRSHCFRERLARDLRAADPVEFAEAEDMLTGAADDWSVELLGEYGTGEYDMFGAFWLSLRTGLVRDDPTAAPRYR
jgi:hypothetical protein